MNRREPTDAERQELRDQLLGVAWTWARRLADLGGDDGPMSPYDGTEDQQRAATLARGRALELLAEAASAAAADDLRYAGQAAAPTAWWTRDDVLAYLAGTGTPITADTWSGYASRGQAPAPARHIGRTPLWDSTRIVAWQAARRGRGWRASTTGQETDS